MKRLALPSVFAALIGLVAALGPVPDPHPSKTSEVFATYRPAVEARTIEAMIAAVGAFDESLDDERRAEFALALDDPERQRWTNVPPGADEDGVRLGDLSEAQLKTACDLLATVLSPQGYQKARDILLADDKLLRGGRPRTGFGAENFWLVLFGKPSADGTWGLQLDGHHLAVNLTIDGGRMTMSPSFIGTQPSEYERDGAKVAPLRGQVDDAFALVGLLTEEQRAKAVLSAKRGSVAAGAGRDGFVPDPIGLQCSTFDPAQKAVLMKLIAQYLGDLPEPFATQRIEALEAEVDDMVFAWSGPLDNPSDVSYRVQGPTLIIEYACQDLGGNPLDHLHSMYRDPKNEYGSGFAQDR